MMRRWGAALLSTVTVFLPSVAHAQEFGPLLGTEIPFETNLGKNVGVVDRPRPELDPLGIPVAGFLLYPKLGFGTGYTNNVYGSASQKTGDAFFTVEPDISLQSQWSRNALNFQASGKFKEYASQGAKNENAYTVSSNGRIDIGDSDKIEAIANYQRDYEEQYSGSFPANAAGSVPYTRATGLIRGTFELNRIRLIGNLDINQFNFSNTKTLTGALIDLKFRDRTDARAAGRVEYALSPNTAAFVEATYLNSDYNHKNLAGGDRTSHEVRVLGGFTFDISSLLRANLGVGVVRRDYDAAKYGNINGVAADVQLSYFVDTLTTITLSGRRDVQDAITENTPGFFSSRVQLRVDHELLRNLLPYIEGDYERDSYKNVSRRDSLYTITGGADYKTNHNIEIEPQVSYTKRDSSGLPLGQIFSEVRALIKVTAKL